MLSNNNSHGFEALIAEQIVFSPNGYELVLMLKMVKTKEKVSDYSIREVK